MADLDYSNIFPLSGGGSWEFTEITTNTTVTDSAKYLIPSTGVIANISIDVSSLSSAEGKTLKIVNYNESYQVFVSGTLSVNGVTTPSNHVLNVPPLTTLDLTFLTNSLDCMILGLPYVNYTPSYTYLPSLVYDTFNVASDTSLIGRSVGSNTWIAHTLNTDNTPNIVASTRELDCASSVADWFLLGSSSTTDSISKITHNGTGNGVMMLFRTSSSVRNGYGIRLIQNTNQYQIGKWVNGAFTSLVSVVSSAPSTPYTIEGRCVGSLLSLYLNNTLILSTTDTTYASGYNGLRFGGGSIMNYEVYPNAIETKSIDGINVYQGWMKESSTLKSQRTGSSLLITFNGNFLGLNLTNPSGITGYILVSVNGARWDRFDLQSGTYVQPIYHDTSNTIIRTVRVVLGGNNSTTDNWVTPTNQVSITGISVQTGKALYPSVPRTRKMVVIGDSIARGRALQPDTSWEYGHAVSSWAYLLAQDLNAEMEFIAFSGQGYSNAGAGGEPKAATSLNLYSSGKTRPVQYDVEKVFIAHGTNDGGTADATIAADATTTWTLARTQYPNAKIIVILPLGYSANTGSPSLVGFRDAKNTVISNAYTSWSDTNKQLIDLTSEVYGNSMTGALSGGSNSYTSDLIHPSIATNILIKDSIKFQL